MNRTEFTKATRVARFKLCGGRCEGMLDDGKGGQIRCDAVLVAGRVEYDHNIADGLGGDNSLENCRAICSLCHRDKTRIDIGAIAQAKRREAKAIGIKSDKPKITSPGFPQTREPARITKQSLPPLRLYQDA